MRVAHSPRPISVSRKMISRPFELQNWRDLVVGLELGQKPCLKFAEVNSGQDLGFKRDPSIVANILT